MLLIAIPLLAIVLVPFFIAIRKDNKTKGTIASLIFHILIVICVSLCAGGLISTTVMTETHVYVVADVSYSANRNLDEINQYIDSLEDNLPKNSKLGLVCFGANQELLTSPGEDIKSVLEATEIDDGATDIISALEYTAGLFEEDVIKRIVLISDGKQTDNEATPELIRTVETLYEDGIYVDAIYLDDNLREGENEIQISGVDASISTYVNHVSTATVMLSSSYDSSTGVVVSLYLKNNETGEYTLLKEEHQVLSKDYYTFVTFDELVTSEAGVYDYKVSISSQNDISPYNNEYIFSQTVSGELSVLLITTNQEDVDKATELYGEDATIDAYVKPAYGAFTVPFLLEELCQYDEILMSDVDVRELDNYLAFIDNLESVVFNFGKSLVVMGDTKIQNKTDETLADFEAMLPVEYGNASPEGKLYVIVIDISRSMYQASRIIMARDAAIKLLNIMEPDDRVAVISFSGDVETIQPITEASNKESIARVIEGTEASQGTYLGLGLKRARQLVMPLGNAFSQREIIVISDGETFTSEVDDAISISAELGNAGCTVSTINVLNEGNGEAKRLLENIANAGKGEYYPLNSTEELDDLIFSDMADDLTGTVIEAESKVNIANKKDSIVDGVSILPNVHGFLQSSAKPSTTTPVTVTYVSPSGRELDVPLYSYRSYGKGKVSCFMSKLSGEWLREWQSGNGNEVLGRIINVNIPNERITYPYTVDVTYDGAYANIEITPAKPNLSATMTLNLTLPNGEAVNEVLPFDSAKYTYQFLASELGKYQIDLTYAYGERSFDATSIFNLSYSPEYDAFVTFDASNLHQIIGNVGQVSENGTLVLENNESEIDTYEYDFKLPLMIVAVCLFVVDVIVRKIKLRDITGLFRRVSKEEIK